MLEPLSFMRDEKCIELAWHVREGLLGRKSINRNEGCLHHLNRQDFGEPENRVCPGSDRHTRGGEDQDHGCL